MMRPATYVLAVLMAAFGIWSCTDTGGAEPVALQDIALEVECDGSQCPIRVVLEQDEHRMVSQPLPFPASAATIEPSEADESFGHLLAGQEPRELAAWSVGADLEKAIGVAVELAETGGGGTALVVHQVAGFEHLKRAHVILAPASSGLVEVERFVEGAGPELILLAPVEGGIGIERISPDGATSSERLRWQSGSEEVPLGLQP